LMLPPFGISITTLMSCGGFFPARSLFTDINYYSTIMQYYILKYIFNIC
jgi:hypothetical protein